jgi:hypothetical protein
MKVVLLRCKTCGGSLETSDSRSSAKCIYCGSLHVVETGGTSNGQKLAALLIIAEECRKERRDRERKNREANRYYTRVLEMDPGNVEAWIGRGLTDQTFLRGPFEKAVTLAADESSVKRKIAEELDRAWWPGAWEEVARYQLSLIPKHRRAALALAKKTLTTSLSDSDFADFRRALDATDNDEEVRGAIVDNLAGLLNKDSDYFRNTNRVKTERIAEFVREIPPPDNQVRKILARWRDEDDQRVRAEKVEQDRERQARIWSRIFKVTLALLVSPIVGIILGFPISCTVGAIVGWGSRNSGEVASDFGVIGALALTALIFGLAMVVIFDD